MADLLTRTTPPPENTGVIERAALALTDWTERWVPDAFVFALIGTFLVVGRRRRCSRRRQPAQVIDAWGERILGADSVHAPDGAHHHHRPRARDLAADGRGDSHDRGLADDAERRRRTGGVLCDGELVVQLGLQPDLQRRARARGRAARRRRRLSRARGRELPRHRQRLGAGIERLGGAPDGHAWRAAASDSRHRGERRHRSRAASSRSATPSFCGRASCRSSWRSRSSPW